MPSSLRSAFARAAGPAVARLRVIPDAALEHDTRALALGNKLYFHAGEYQPDTRRGRELIAHEVAHGLQQSVGHPHAPAPGPAHEHNARQIAGRLVGGRTVARSQVLPASVGPARQQLGESVIELDELSFTVASPYTGERYQDVDYAEAERRNGFWDQRLKAWSVSPFAPIDAFASPVEYANVVYRFQKWVQYSGLDEQLVGERLVRDGVLGPRTLRLIAAVATHSDRAAMIASAERWGFSAVMVERWHTLASERWRQMGLSAAIELEEPTIAAAWSPDAIDFAQVLGYWRHHGLTVEMERSLDFMFEVEPGATITHDQRFAALQRLFAGTRWEVYYTILETPRERLELLESERVVTWKLDESLGDTSVPFLFFGISTASALEAAERLLDPELPSTGDAAEILARLRGSSAPRDGALPAMTIGLRMPETTS
ncbi:MAG TPA: DUF4157 domain-containing protein, partial [Enhygromyxa sp.]|nr:DUF4157 domain-containing protein [Enhygromyxa sp.]